MTETELNEQIERIEALRIEMLPPSPGRLTGAAYRREMRTRKNDALVRAVSRRYIPRAPYVDWGFDGPTLLHSGYYIKYPRSSKEKKLLKRLTSKRCRRECTLPLKGKRYRRILDYWWILD
ncbi:MAG: hypothetical protein ACI3W5_14470 [Faecousia sp.]